MIISIGQLVVFFLILGRIAGVFIQAPIFSSKSFPMFGKTALAIWISLVLWFVVPISKTLPQSLVGLILAVVIEVAIGFLIGFVCNIIFIGVQAAGEIMDMQMGLSVATALDPVFGAVISVIGRLAFYTAIIIFITADGHHLILSAFNQSFQALPVGKMANFASPNLVLQLIGLGSALWVTAIKLAAPVILLIFISDFTFGIVSRVAPQVNVFMLGFQVKPSLGLIGFLLSLPFLVKYINKLIAFMLEQTVLLLNVLK
ncbi:MAG: flagellar biosynthetic protein FliR [Candidatus Saganbacteria bacterium]|nr:flagellar biosynthetic protein FliR [Candidatus Saganbacteria bacterium]